MWLFEPFERMFLEAGDVVTIHNYLLRQIIILVFIIIQIVSLCLVDDNIPF